MSFTAPGGAITALLGPSGSGKSTVLRMIAGLETPNAGRIWLGDVELTAKSVQERARRVRVPALRAVPAHDRGAERRVRPRRAQAVARRAQGARRRAARARAAGALRRSRYPDQLSGGQRQRVALARALAPRPEVLLLDEPFGALDAKVRQDLRQWLDELHRELGVTSLLVTHDQEEALELANQVVVMHEGRVEQVGSPSEIYDDPQTPFVAGFVGVGERAARRGRGWPRAPRRVPAPGADHLDEGVGRDRLRPSARRARQPRPERQGGARRGDRRSSASPRSAGSRGSRSGSTARRPHARRARAAGRAARCEEGDLV